MPAVSRTPKEAVDDVGAIDRLRAAADADLEAHRASHKAAHDAPGTPETEARRFAPSAVAHRLDAIENEQRRIRRQLKNAARTPGKAPALEARERELATQAERWAAVRREQIAQGIAADRSGISKGDQVRWHGQWLPVLRANARSVIVSSPWGNEAVPHHELTGHSPSNRDAGVPNRPSGGPLGAEATNRSRR
ncbi:hypothetical protein SPF06_18660 [Sinomonas sp. JGH33]|uniref:Uncharacterized protein n=1 Tax=Sinomonas terricola TaxID=3110330 RepID=A0ABU5TAN7_9MICC|nr:hypothetical protein [Sinomonas sp. JGH33]MEA5456750.1 hypothetical protein [Sinomonas sp. JGH33]